MIRVTIDLYSATSHQKKELLTIDISNDGTGDSARGFYDVKLGNDEQDSHFVHGRVENYDRSRNILELVRRAVDAVTL